MKNIYTEKNVKSIKGENANLVLVFNNDKINRVFTQSLDDDFGKAYRLTFGNEVAIKTLNPKIYTKAEVYNRKLGRYRIKYYSKGFKVTGNKVNN